MNMPGFTATASLYRTSRHYRMTVGSDLNLNSIEAATLLEVDGVPTGTITGIDEINGIIYYDPFFGGGPGVGRLPPLPPIPHIPQQHCYTCQLAGGVGICCFTVNSPDCPGVQECVALGARIIDGCKDSGGSDAVCSRKGVCAFIQCTEQHLGSPCANCGGIV